MCQCGGPGVCPCLRYQVALLGPLVSSVAPAAMRIPATTKVFPFFLFGTYFMCVCVCVCHICDGALRSMYV